MREKTKTKQRLDGVIASTDGWGMSTIDPHYKEMVAWRFGNRRTVVTVYYDRQLRPRRFTRITRDARWVSEGGKDLT